MMQKRRKKKFSRYKGRPALTQARERVRYSQENMAALLGISRATYSAYETGTRTPPLAKAARIAVILNHTVGEIFPDIFDQAKQYNKLPELGPDGKLL